MNLIHFSNKKITNLINKPKVLSISHHNHGYKPNGLWISDEDEHGWKQWCLGEDYGTHTLINSYKVELDLSKILLITDVHQLDEFHGRFHTKEYSNSMSFGLIDWNEVQEEYNGILITPYFWERRLNGRASKWYYGWDCASGCIWNIDSIKSFTEVIQKEELCS